MFQMLVITMRYSVEIPIIFPLRSSIRGPPLLPPTIPFVISTNIGPEAISEPLVSAMTPCPSVFRRLSQDFPFVG